MMIGVGGSANVDVGFAAAVNVTGAQAVSATDVLSDFRSRVETGLLIGDAVNVGIPPPTIALTPRIAQQIIIPMAVAIRQPNGILGIFIDLK